MKGGQQLSPVRCVTASRAAASGSVSRLVSAVRLWTNMVNAVAFIPTSDNILSGRGILGGI